MRTRIGLFVIAWMLAWTMQAQSFDVLWERVEQMEAKDLPKSVISEANKIYEKAKFKRDVPQMMKAYLTMMAWQEKISPDSLQVDIKGLEEWALQKEVEEHDKAVLYSILGGVLIRNDFEKGSYYLKLSLKDSLKLVNYPAGDLAPLVKAEQISRLYFNDNLYDLLARRAIRLWEQNQWNVKREQIQQAIRHTYHTLLNIYKVKEMRAAWLLTALDAYPQADEVQLREWIKEYRDLEVCAEVYLKLAQKYPYKNKPAERLELLREGIRLYPHYYRINMLKNEEHAILRPKLHLMMGNVYPDSPIQIEVEHCNLSGLEMKFYRVNLSVESALLSKVNVKTISKYGTLIRRKHYDLPATSDYLLRRDTLTIEGFSPGVYYAVAIPKGHRETAQGVLVYVTGLQIIHRALPGDEQEIVVLNRRSGHPVAGSQINVFAENIDGFSMVESHIANSKGVIMLKKNYINHIHVQAQLDNDKFMPITPVWLGDNRYKVTGEVEEHVNLFTDRSIYRPGQLLYFSGIVYSQLRDSVHVKQGCKQMVTLLDASHKEVDTQEVETDDFGNFSGTFELPKSGKLGVYTLKTERGRTTFRVEEYKRPSFEVIFDTLRINYRAGDSVRVKGLARSFSGAPMQNAKVKYTVTRIENKFWRMHGVETNRVVGEVITDAEGCFKVPVYFSPITGENKNIYFTYKVSAHVTSLSGETQESILALPLGNTSMKLFIPDWEGKSIVKERPKSLTFLVNNLMDEPIDAIVDYQVLLKGKLMIHGKAASNKAFVLKDLDTLPSGCYELMAKVKDAVGGVVEYKVVFTLLSLSDKRLPEGVEIWSHQSNEEFDENGKATLYFGCREKDVFLFYDVMYGDNQMERKHIVFSDSLLAFHYTYREEYGDGLRCSFAFLKNDELYVKQLFIKKPAPKKALKLKWKTFRDKLKPGTKETWTLSILRPDGKPVDARLMATMYDASLDKLMPYAWHFGVNFARNFPKANWRNVKLIHPYWDFNFPVKNLKDVPLLYSRLELPRRFSIEEERVGVFKSNALMGRAKNVDKLTLEESLMMAPSGALLTSNDDDKMLLRTDFAETAFFYPKLRTDINGDVDVEFTLPESLTEWTFIGFAHTQEMDYGSITDRIVASKDFMLQTNLPRFVRVGDQVNVTTSLMNLSGKNVKGMVKMELFLPDSEKIVLSQKLPFYVEAEETGNVSFNFKVMDKYEGLGIRIVADGDTFSDGEQHYLPVLSSKQKLTETLLLNANGKGTFVYPLESLFNHHSNVSGPQMWVEYTGNPMWHAIQALKVVAEPKEEDAFSWASTYYANALLVYLTKTSPIIANSVKFDVGNVDKILSEAVSNLKSLQNIDGAWSWYKGMNGNLYTTISITQLLSRLQNMVGSLSDTDVTEMLKHSWKYLNKFLAEEKQSMQEAEQKGKANIELSNIVLRCLYADALDKSQRIPEDISSYFMSKLEKMSKRFNIYDKALSAVVLEEAGQETQAKEILRSLMEYSVKTEEMGRYFDSPKAYYSWCSYKIPTQVAVIEAVSRIENEDKALEEMRQWLLKQKQAQIWDTPIATTDAVYALLATGGDWVSSASQSQIQTRGNKIIISEGENKKREGDWSGYSKQKIQGDIMNFDQVIVKRKSSGIGWGAIYAEFEADMDEVNAQGSALKIIRTLCKDGKPLTEKDIMQVGDCLTVLLTVVADRDMDFVQVKDERAACMEPVKELSGYQWNRGVGYYQEIKDSSTSFYFDKMRKGEYKLQYEVYLTSSGEYAQGVPVVSSVYAPEFIGHGKGERLIVR